MKNVLRIFAFTVVALGLFYAPAAKADTFTLTGSGTTSALDAVTLSLTLTSYTPLGSGNFLITGITGSGITTSDPSFVTGNSTGIIPGGPGAFITPSGKFNVDNVLYASSALLDSAGLAFYIGSTEANIWSNGDGTYSLYELVNGSYASSTLTSLTVTHDTYGTPEPITLMLFGTGLMGIGGMVRRKLNR
jgi:hypothetical protein